MVKMKWNNDEVEMHDCSQGATLATICEKLDQIEKMISTFKTELSDQRITQNKMELEIAKITPLEEVKDAIRKVALHETYFKIMYFVVGALTTLVVGLLIAVLREFVV